MCDDPASPSASPGDHAECGDDTEHCPHCVYWTQNHAKEVSSMDSKWLDSSQFAARRVAFHFAANLASGEIMVTLRFSWGTLDAALTEAMKTEIKNALKTDAPAAWSNKHDMKIIDPICGEKTVPVRVRVQWNPGDTTVAHHCQVNLSKTAVRSSAGHPNVNLDYDDDLDDDAWTIKHEFGHLLAAPDEYLYSGTTSATIDYERADGSTETITLEPGDTIMQTRRNVTVAKRFLYVMEIEAQELLRAKSGRDVTCEIV